MGTVADTFYCFVAEERRPSVGDEGEEERAGGAKGMAVVGRGVTINAAESS